MNTELYLGGQWVSALDGKRIPVVDPATGEPFADVANGTVADRLAAVAAADAALPAWAARAPRERGEILRLAYELMAARTDALAELVVRENGKALPVFQEHAGRFGTDFVVGDPDGGERESEPVDERACR